jgi:hypothetical protein
VPTITTTGPLTTATQLASYTYCCITATGGSGSFFYNWAGYPLTFPGVQNGYANLPEGMTLNSSTGAISSSKVNAQGNHTVLFTATDAGGYTVSQPLLISVSGNNTFGGNSLIPANSLYNYPYGTMTNLAPSYFQIPSAYLGRTLQLVGGQNSGMTINTVPYNQPNVTVEAGPYGPYTFTSGPIPCDTSYENGTNYWTPNNDSHTLTVQLPGGGNPLEIWETYQQYNFPYLSSNCVFSNGQGQGGYSTFNLVPGTYALTNGLGSTDAAGLPVSLLLDNMDEIIGTGTATSPNGSIPHLSRFITPQYSYNHTIHVPPATSSYGTSCTAGTGFTDPTNNGLITETPGQGNSRDGTGPLTCPNGPPLGQVLVINSTFAEPSGCSSNPVTHILFTAWKTYGFIVADLGGFPYPELTQDARWPNDTIMEGCLNSITLGNLVAVRQTDVVNNSNYAETQVGTSQAVTSSTPAGTQFGPGNQRGPGNQMTKMDWPTVFWRKVMAASTAHPSPQGRRLY